MSKPFDTDTLSLESSPRTPRNSMSPETDETSYENGPQGDYMLNGLPLYTDQYSIESGYITTPRLSWNAPFSIQSDPYGSGDIFIPQDGPYTVEPTSMLSSSAPTMSRPILKARSGVGLNAHLSHRVYLFHLLDLLVSY